MVKKVKQEMYVDWCDGSYSLELLFQWSLGRYDSSRWPFNTFILCFELFVGKHL